MSLWPDVATKKLWKELEEHGFKVELRKNADIDSPNSIWSAKKKGVAIRGYYNKKFEIYLINNKGGYDLCRQHSWHKPDLTDKEYLQKAYDYIPPENIATDFAWVTPTENKEPPVKKGYREYWDRWAWVASPIVCAQVIGVVGMKYPKVAFEWIEEDQVDVYYVLHVRNVWSAKLYLISDGKKFVPCKIPRISGTKYTENKFDIKLIRGYEFNGVDLNDIGIKDMEVIQKAIEIYQAGSKWVGVKW